MSDAVELEAKQIADRESEAYKRVPKIERNAGTLLLIVAAVSMGLGFDSGWIGLGTFCSLLFLAVTLSNAMTKHRYLTRNDR